jgi:hypothetical protein
MRSHGHAGRATEALPRIKLSATRRRSGEHHAKRSCADLASRKTGIDTRHRSPQPAVSTGSIREHPHSSLGPAPPETAGRGGPSALDVANEFLLSVRQPEVDDFCREAFDLEIKDRDWPHEFRQWAKEHFDVRSPNDVTIDIVDAWRDHYRQRERDHRAKGEWETEYDPDPDEMSTKRPVTSGGVKDIVT